MWKILAIIFIIATVVETMFIGWIFSIGTAAIENEEQCIYDLCGADEYTSYIYDDVDELCYCYYGDGDYDYDVFRIK